MTDRMHTATAAGPLAARIAAMTDADLNAFAGSVPPLNDADLAAADEFGRRLQSMTDEQIHREWGIASPQLVADIRELFAKPWS